MTVKLHSRRSDAPFEPSKYGGRGFCDERSKSLPAEIKNQNQIFLNSSQILKSFKIEPWEWRGIGIHFELVPRRTVILVTNQLPLISNQSKSINIK